MKPIIYIFSLLCVIPFLCLAQEENKKKELTADDDYLLIQKEYLKKKDERRAELEDTLRKVLISDPDTTSLVVSNTSKLPLLTVSMYNHNIKQIVNLRWTSYLEMKSNEKPVIDIDTIRSNILFSIFEQAYVKDMWSKNKEQRLFNDSLQHFLIREQKQHSNIDKDTILQAKYKWYYNYLFAQKNQSVFNVLVSTDSLLLDSLLNSISYKAIDCNPCEKNNNCPLLKKDLVVDTYRYDSLAEDLRPVADSVKNSQWSKITKCKWGYVILGLNRKKIKKEIPVEEIYDQLVYLPDTANLMLMLTEERMIAFFEENKRFFQNDTNCLSVKISPHLYKNNKGQIISLSTPHENISEFRCTDRELPAAVRQSVLNYMDLNKCDSTGWFDNEYGIWKIRRISKRSGKDVDFAQCRNNILRLMKPALIQRQYERAESIIGNKKEEKSLRFFTDFFYSNSSGKLSTGRPNTTTVNEINKWASQNITVKFK